MAVGIKRWFSNGFKAKDEIDAEKDARHQHLNEERRIRGQKPIDWEQMEEDSARARSKWDGQSM